MQNLFVVENNVGKKRHTAREGMGGGGCNECDEIQIPHTKSFTQLKLSNYNVRSVHRHSHAAHNVSPGASSIASCARYFAGICVCTAICVCVCVCAGGRGAGLIACADTNSQIVMCVCVCVDSTSVAGCRRILLHDQIFSLN